MIYFTKLATTRGIFKNIDLFDEHDSKFNGEEFLSFEAIDEDEVLKMIDRLKTKSCINNASLASGTMSLDYCYSYNYNL